MHTLMPLPTELEALQATVPAPRRRAARQAADLMPLVHVVSQEARFVEMLLFPPRQLKVTDPANSKSTTLGAERQVGWAPSVYFYAGRVFQPGAVALLFAGGYEQGREGGFTPFDSGGMIHGHIHCAITHDVARRVAYCQACHGALPGCRQALANFLAVYFFPLSDYLDGQPCRPHSLGIYPTAPGVFPFGENDWRAWTFEIRLTAPVDLPDAVKWAPSEDEWARFLDYYESAYPAQKAVLLEFARSSLAREGALNYRALAEAEIRRITGL